MTMPVFICQPRPVAGFRGTVRYASVNAHKNKVSICQVCDRGFVSSVMLSCMCLPLLFFFDSQTLSNPVNSELFSFCRRWDVTMTCGLSSTCWWSSWSVSCRGGRSRIKWGHWKKWALSWWLQMMTYNWCVFVYFRNMWESWKRLMIIVWCSNIYRQSLVCSWITSPALTTLPNLTTRYDLHSIKREGFPVS